MPRISSVFHPDWAMNPAIGGLLGSTVAREEIFTSLAGEEACRSYISRLAMPVPQPSITALQVPGDRWPTQAASRPFEGARPVSWISAPWESPQLSLEALEST